MCVNSYENLLKIHQNRVYSHGRRLGMGQLHLLRRDEQVGKLSDLLPRRWARPRVLGGLASARRGREVAEDHGRVDPLEQFKYTFYTFKGSWYTHQNWLVVHRPELARCTPTRIGRATVAGHPRLGDARQRLLEPLGAITEKITEKICN